MGEEGGGLNVQTIVCNAAIVVGGDLDDARVTAAMEALAKRPPVVIVVDRNATSEYRTWIEPGFLSTLGDGGRVNQRLYLDLAARELLVDGSPIVVTRLQYDILLYLVQHAGQAVSREELARAVWGYEDTNAATITVHIGQLRRKLERDPRNPAHLVTIRRVGYRFDP